MRINSHILSMGCLVSPLLLSLISATQLLSAHGPKSSLDSASSTKQIAEHYGELPLSFEKNRGQAESETQFLSRGLGYSILVRDSEADLLLSKRDPESDKAAHTAGPNSGGMRAALLRMHLRGLKANIVPVGDSPLPETVNYFTGNDPAKWLSAIPTFARVKYANVYPGINLTYYGNQQRLEFDFAVAPGADPKSIRFRLDGARKLTIDRHGNLVVTTEDGPVTFRAPAIYQPDADGYRHPIDGCFKLSAHRTVSFAVGNYDHAKPLIIDPILNYSTFLGPTNGDDTAAVAVDTAGNAYVTGTAFLGFPTTPGTFQANPPTDTLMDYPFVAKLNSTGTALVYSTYLMGSGGGLPTAIAVDASGNAYVTGITKSKDFPVTPGAFQTINPAVNGVNPQAGFVTKLNSTGTGLVYSTFLGGSSLTYIPAIAIDSAGDALVTGYTEDSDFPTTAGAFQAIPKAPPDPNDPTGFVSKLNPTGTALLYSSYLSGGGFGDYPQGIALDPGGNAFITGYTSSSGFPVTSGALQSGKNTGGLAGFVTKINSDGTSLAYSTFLSGSGGESDTMLGSIAVDVVGNAYVAGVTQSPNYPTTSGAIDIPQSESFVVSKINSSGSALVYSAIFGGGGTYQLENTDAYNFANAIAVDSQGEAIIAGCTSALNYPVTDGAFQTQNLAMLNSLDPGGIVTKINSMGTAFLYSTFLSGTGDGSGEGLDCGRSLALDAAGNVYLSGTTISADFPTTPGSVQSSALFPGAFVSELSASEMTTLPSTTLNISLNSPSVEYGQPVTFTTKVQPTSGQTPTGAVGFSFYGVEGSDDSGVGFGPWSWVPIDSSGNATFTLDTGKLTLDKLDFNAQYLGDANNAPSYASGVETLTLVPTTVTVTATQKSAIYGAPVTFTATVLENTGKPARGVVAFASEGSYFQVGVDANGQASWANGFEGELPLGTDTVTVQFDPEVGDAPSSATTSVTITPLGTTPAPTFSVPGGTYSTSQGIYLSDSIPGAPIYFTTDGSTPTVNTGNWYSMDEEIVVSSNESIQAIAVVDGYAPSAVVSASYTILPPPPFALAGTAVYVSPGITTNNTSTITLTPSNGFTGTVALSAAVTSSPAGAVDIPTVSFGATNSVSVTSENPVSATLTISTTSRQFSTLTSPRAPGSRLFEGGMALAGLAIFGVHRRRRKWKTLVGLSVLFLAAICAPLACGGGGGGGGSQLNPGTTPGEYTITVTGTSGTAQETTAVQLTVD